MPRDANPEPSKRLLRQRIARLRRRIDGQVHGLRREGRRLVSWRFYVTRYPVHTLVAAMGLGLTASAGFRRGVLARLLGLHLVRRATGRSVDAIFAELKTLWADATPAEQSSPCDGADHVRS